MEIQYEIPHQYMILFRRKYRFDPIDAQVV